ncbi:MAG: thiol reductant ABC exporter subunit CydC [Agromyces sp.]
MTPTEVLHAAVPDRRRFAWSLALAILTNVSAVALLATSMWLIVRAAERPPILFLGFAVVGVRAFALGRAVFRYVERLVSHDSVFRQLPQLRVRVYARLAELAPWGITGAQRGDTLSRFVRDVDELQFYPLRALLPSWSALGFALASGFAVGLLSPAAAIALIGTLGVGTALSSLAVRSGAQRNAETLATARGAVADAVLDAVENWNLLTAFGAAQTAQDRVIRSGIELSQRERQMAGRVGLANAILIMSGAVAIVLAALAVAPLVEGGTLTVPGAAVVVLLPIAIADVLAAIPLATQARARVSGAAKRIAQLLPDETPAEIPDERIEQEQHLRPLGSMVVQLRDVSAKYPGSSTPAIRGVDLELATGECVLLTGPSGAGKSTLAQVLARTLEYGGSATLGGVELRELGAATVRRNVVLCEQLPWLFHTSIRGNLQFAQPGVTDAELLAVLDRVGLTTWVHARGGLDAEVGERGELVSGGQAQRIALARALLSDAPVIICDEPTANIEPSLAEQLLRDIAGLSPERSVLIVSHESLPSGVTARTLRMEAGRLR